MTTQYLSSSQLKRLKEHKYSADGTSICEPWMQVFWRWLVEQIPKTWAPNTITLVGLLLNVLTTLILIIYSPDGQQEAPRWVYLCCALGLFVYQSLDAIDGKQARRTNTNTPLGELFDHGCDSLSTVFVMTGCCVALKLGQEPYVFLFEIAVSEFCFYLAHWQTYVTGTLKFNTIDVTEGQFTVIFIYLFCAIYPGFFDFCLPVVGVPFRYLAVLGSLIPSSIFMLNSTQIILQGGVGKNKSTVAGSSTIFPVVPIGLTLVLQTVIAHKTSIFLDHPCLYLIAFGMVTSKVTNLVVVATMTRSEMALIDACFIGPFLLFLNQYFNSLIPEYFLLSVVCVINTYDLLKFSTVVCQEICAYLKIYCFDITSTPDKNSSNGRNVN